MIRTKKIYISRFKPNVGDFVYSLGNGCAKTVNAVGKYFGTAVLNPKDLKYLDFRLVGRLEKSDEFAAEFRNEPTGDNKPYAKCPDCGGTGIGSTAHGCNETREYDCIRCHGSGTIA